jgi:hypothetical protein
MNIEGNCDASWANCEDYASISGWLFKVGGNLISWSSKKQSVIALSTAESEYMAAGSATQEAIWLKGLMEELKLFDVSKTISIYEDNEGCIALSKNPQDHKRTRHIQVKYHFLRSHVQDKTIAFPYIPTKDQLADMLTKGLTGPMLKNFATLLGYETSQPGEVSKYAASVSSLSMHMALNVIMSIRGC